MDGWMYRQTWIDGGMDIWGRMNEWTDTDRLMDGWMDRQMDRVDGQMNGWIDRWINGWMDVQTGMNG